MVLHWAVFDGFICSSFRTGMKLLCWCIWKVRIGYRSNTLPFFWMGGETKSSLKAKHFKIGCNSSFLLPLSSSFQLLFLSACFAVAHTDAGDHLCSLHKWLQQVPSCAGCSSRSRLPRFVTVFPLSRGTHPQGAGV